ncbi:methylated-DNA--[protein]-cysteine S-methyltransferase [Mucilaginibacter sp. BJC16-A38]|uniref:methylated-DNA--[protein]-cysteine S-methyltransferase n=1 Tax=Mucilaginibacter phenanthrenivorans TaxID=1234842 RepID=UPI0021577667|nr:methylated-DNA--[protein]-cysteine S-methyltransferase [Mucilaginibacter phenanthrenivorans]MCR8557086.1 methylated-DNA--[protein]-cysteine S-methyltransferase [Mucilaginibacter phenanthrenivorans]
MPTAYCKTPIGIISITEEDGFITSIYALDEEHEVTPPETPLLQLAIQQLDEYFAGDRKVFDLPIKQQGSAFQQQVWDQLCKIGYGKTISYMQQSKFMNNPLGIRAIASANGKNHLLIVVPCHRVIGTDGSLTGFGAGIWRKKILLEHEARVMGVGQTTLDF